MDQIASAILAKDLEFVLRHFVSDLIAHSWIVSKASRLVRSASGFGRSCEETLQRAREQSLQKSTDAAVRTPRDVGLTGRSDITPTPRPLIRKVRNRSPNSECVQRMLNSKRKGQWVQQAISGESVSTGSIEFESPQPLKPWFETLQSNSGGKYCANADGIALSDKGFDERCETLICIPNIGLWKSRVRTPVWPTLAV
jgi:hypothetical protein